MSDFLVGKTISDIKIAEDKKAILFITDFGDVIAKADGDCCSSSWIEHIELPALGFPAKVLSVEDIDMPKQEYDESEFDVVSFYGLKIVTSSGDMVIDYRNDSNGYYGGNLSWPDDKYFYGGVHGQNVSDEKWVDVVNDI